MPETNSPIGATSQHFEVFSERNLQYLDETVIEVFGVQFGIDVDVCPTSTKTEKKTNRHNEQTALIGFAGALSGLCEIRLSIPASIAITEAMLPGTPVTAESELLCDAVGELCNLLAGGWKNRLPELGALCSLSVPTVIGGEEYQIHRPANVVVAQRMYAFGDHRLVLTLVYDPG